MNTQKLHNGVFSLVALLLAFASNSAQAGERVVSLNGSLTEIVYALGLQDRLVGVDTTSLYPAEATKLASVGYQRALNAEGIVSLQPSLLLSTNHAGPAAALEQVESLGVERLLISDEYSLDGVLQKIHAVAGALGAEEAGRELAERVSTESLAAQAGIPENSSPRTLFFLGTGNGSPSVAGGATAADAIIKLAGGQNPFDDNYTSYKPVNAESLLLAAPEVILVSRRAFDAAGGVTGILELPGVADTPAGKARRIYGVDTLLMLGFGPRLPLAIEALVAQIHHRDG